MQVSKRITEVLDVSLVDADGQPGFEIELGTQKANGEAGAPVKLTLTTATLGELVAELAYEGMGGVRDYEYELVAAINAGVTRRQKERV